MRKILTILFCLLLTVSSSFLTKVRAEGTTVYVDPSGADGAYTRLDLAAAALPSEGGTIVIKADADTSLSSSSPTLTASGKIRIVGENPSVKLTQKRALIANCELEIDNLVYVNGAASSVDFIYCGGNDVTIGSNVTSLPSSAGRYVSIFAGKSSTATTSHGTVNVNGGRWNGFWCGNNVSAKAFSGTLNVNIGTATFEFFSFSGNTGASSATVNATFSNANILEVSKTRNTGTVSGTTSLTINGGTYGTFSNVTPNIDLSSGGTLNLSNSLTAGSLVGGGTINLTSGAVLTANSFSGEVGLSVVSPVDDTAYLIVNDLNSAGVVNYSPASSEHIEKEVSDKVYFKISSTSVGPVDPTPVDTVYLDPAGTSDHSQNVYTTIEAAVDALPNEGGTIVVCSDVQVGTASVHYHMPAKPIRITGETADVKLIQNRSFFINEDTTIDNITWVNNASSSYAFFYCQGHELTVGEDVTCVANGTVYLCILSGSAKVTNGVGNMSNAHTVININSGTFRRIFGGGLGATYAGTVEMNLNSGSIEDIYLAGSGSAGTSSATATVNLNGASIGGIARNSASGAYSGTANLVLKEGSINTIDTNINTSIDLSEATTLTINSSATVDSIVGGGKLILGGSASITSSSLTGSINFEVSSPSDGVTYLTISDSSTNGVVNYIPKGSEQLFRTVDNGDVKYTMQTEKTHIKVTYYNPNGENELQPSIVLYKGYSSDTDKVKILDLQEGFDGYKAYIEADLNPGLHYFLVYYNASNDYFRKYFYITGNEQGTVTFDAPYIPFTANNHEEATTAHYTDQVLNALWDFDKVDVEPFDLVTPTFTMEKYLINNRRFLNNDDLCDFVDSLSSPYLHIYYPFELSPLGNRFPVLVYTKDEVAANISLDEIAQEVNSHGTREILMINGGQHGNEPSGMEGALQFAYELTTEYGEEVLDSFGAVVILPCVSLDNTQRFKREYPDGLNSNRDLMYLSHEGSQNIAYIYQRFMPTVFVSCHEDNENATVNTADGTMSDVHNLAYCSISTPNNPLSDTNGIIDGTADVMNNDVAIMLQNLIDTANQQGFRANHYPTPSYAAVSERTYTLVRGSYAFLIEVQRIWSGKSNYEYSVKEMTVALRNLVAEVIRKDTNDAKTIAQKVSEGRESAKVSVYDPENYFVLKMSANTRGSDPSVRAYVDGTYEQTTKTYKYYDTVTAYRSLPLSYVISADAAHINDVLALLDMHGISYTKLANGTTRALRQYAISDTSDNHGSPVVTIGENAYVTFENGAYEISLNTSDSYLIAYLFEPDSYKTSTFYYTSLYNMGYVDASDGLYRYESDEVLTGESSTVTFMVGNETYQVYDDVEFNSLISAPAAPSQGTNIFIGWYKDSNCTNEWNFAADRVTEDVILYALFNEGHTVRVVNGGFGTAHYTVESSSWATSTGGEVLGAQACVTVPGDYSATTGAALSIYTDLSDVTAIKFKVGNNPEVSFAYTGTTAVTRYLKANNTISSSSTPATDIVKFVANKSTSTLISTRFYNIKDDITITFVHNTYTMNYVDEDNHTTSFEYTKKIHDNEPVGYSYSVPRSSLTEKTDGKYVNMHITTDEEVCGMKISGTLNSVLTEIKFYQEEVESNDVTFGNITASYANGAYDIAFVNLNTDVTVTPITAKDGKTIYINGAGDAEGNDAVTSAEWVELTEGTIKGGGLLTTAGEFEYEAGVPVRVNTSIGKLKSVTITYNGVSHVFSKADLANALVDAYIKADGTIASEFDFETCLYRFVKQKANLYFDLYFYHVLDDYTVDIEYDDVTIAFDDPYSSATSYSVNVKPEGTVISALDSSLTVNSALLKNTTADSIQVGVTANVNKMDGIIVSDGENEYVFTPSSAVQIADYTFGSLRLAKSKNTFYVRFYYLNRDVTIRPHIIETVAASQKLVLNADGTTSLNLTLTTSAGVDTDEAFLRINGEDIPLSSLNRKIDNKDNIVYTYKIDNVSAKNMRDEFTVQFFKNENESYNNEHTISVESYLDTIVEGDYSTKLKNFSSAMLNYGSYVQSLFGHHVSELTAEDFDEAAIESVTAKAENNHEITGTTEGISAYGQNLVLKYNTDFRVYFTLDGSHKINEYVFKDNGEVVSAVRVNDSYCYVSVSNLAAPDLAVKHDISVTLGEEGGLVVNTSAMAYANLIINDPNENPKLINAMKAMYNYQETAAELKNAQVTKVSALDNVTPYNGEKVKVAFVGDSITYGYLASDASLYSYPVQLSGLFSGRYEIGNYGVSASYAIAADSPYNYRSEMPEKSYKNTKRYQPSKNFEPDVVVIMLGTNDIRSILSYGENAVAAYKEAMADLIEEYSALPSVSKIYIATSIVYAASTEVGSYSDGQLQAIQKEIAAEAGVEVIDVYTATRDLFYNNPSTYYNSDKLHPNDTGYQKMAEAIYDYLTNN